MLSVGTRLSAGTFVQYYSSLFVVEYSVSHYWSCSAVLAKEATAYALRKTVVAGTYLQRFPYARLCQKH